MLPAHPSGRIVAQWADELAGLDRAGLRRRLRTIEAPQAATVRVEGREVANFASNNYLNLAADARVVAAAVAAARDFGWGAGASPLVVGHLEPHRRLETRLAQFKATESALVFASGYAANLGTITALVGPGDLILSDKLNHASIIDGCRLSGARLRVYPHNHLGKLQRLLGAETGHRRRLVVTDSLFSMDGDLAPLAPIAGLCDRYDAILMIDEAHATGVFGDRGRGVAEAAGVEDRVPVMLGTLSKALGSVGGYVCGSAPLIDLLVNRARPYLYSTASPPAAAAAAEAALDVIAADPGPRRRLLARAADFRAELRHAGFDTGRSESQIVPLIVGRADRAVEFSRGLANRGILLPAIRPPSVPRGTARLRISLTTAHDDATLQWLAGVLADEGRAMGLVGRHGSGPD